MIETYIIFVICLVGCSLTSYNIGIKIGAEGMIDQLISNGSHDPITKQITIIIDGEDNV